MSLDELQTSNLTTQFIFLLYFSIFTYKLHSQILIIVMSNEYEFLGKRSDQEETLGDTAQPSKTLVDSKETLLGARLENTQLQKSKLHDRPVSLLAEFDKTSNRKSSSLENHLEDDCGPTHSIHDNSFMAVSSEHAKLLTLGNILGEHKIVLFINSTNSKDEGISHHIVILKKDCDDESKEYCIAKLTTNEQTNQHHLKKLGKNKSALTDLVYSGEVEGGSRVLFGYVDDKQIYRMCEMRIDQNLQRTLVSIPVSQKLTLPLNSVRLFCSFCGKYIFFRETDDRIVIFPKDSINQQSMICLNIKSDTGVKKIMVQGKEYEADILSEDLLYITVVRNDSSVEIYSVSKSPQASKIGGFERLRIKAQSVQGCQSLELLDVYFLPAYNLLAHVLKSPETRNLYVVQTFLKFDSDKKITDYQTTLRIKIDPTFFTKDSNSSSYDTEDEQELQEPNLTFSTSFLRDELTRTANIFLLPQTFINRILKISLKFDKHDPTPILLNHMKIELSSEKAIGKLNIGSFPSDQSGQSKRVCSFPITNRQNCILLLKK